MSAAFRCTPMRCGLLFDAHMTTQTARRQSRPMPIPPLTSKLPTTMHRISGKRFYSNNREPNILASFAQEASPKVIYEAPPIHRRLKPSLLRPFLFTIICGVGSYGVAAYLTNVDTEKQQAKVRETTASLFRRASTSVDLALARRTELIAKAKSLLTSLVGTRPDIKNPTTRIYTMAIEWWINKTEAQRVCIALIGIQGLIYIGWKIRPAFFARAFTHYALSGRSYTLLTSTFSHSSGMHFLFNSIAFYSFGPSAMSYLWQPNREPGSDLKESTPAYHFIALFVTAGVVSAFFSHAYSLLYMLPRALMGSRSAAVLPSLGSSGSIYATVVVTALAFPDNQISLILFPFASFPIGGGVATLVLFDVVGLLSVRFRMLIARNLGIMLDHAGHLGGALCGWLAFSFGGPFFDALRRILGPPANVKQASKQIPLRRA